MKLHVLLAAVSLGIFVSLSGSAPGHTNTQLPVLMRLGEEYYIRLDNADQEITITHRGASAAAHAAAVRR